MSYRVLLLAVAASCIELLQVNAESQPLPGQSQ